MTNDSMDYLGYLLTHEYADLPQAIKKEISAEDYGLRRKQALLLNAAGAQAQLPPGLRAAYRAQVSTGDKSERSARPYPLLWRAAAAILLLIAGWLIGQQTVEAETQTVYQLISSPVLEPQVEWRYDTIEYIRQQTRTVRDTLWLERTAPPPQIVTVYDTVRVAGDAGQPTLVRGSRSMAGKENLLELLVSTR